MTLPAADLDIMKLASWHQCSYIDETTGMQCQCPVPPHKGENDHKHATYHPGDYDIPPWERRIVSFELAQEVLNKKS